MTILVLEPLKSVLGTIIPRTPNSPTSIEEICDCVRNEWRLYQFDTVIPVFHVTTEDSQGRSQTSYWKRVHEEHDLMLVPEESGCDDTSHTSGQRRIDDYWEEVSRMKDEMGNLKYPYLTSVVNCVLPLSHGNAAPECGFSLNKNILEIHGASLNDETLVSLRIIKDACIRANGFLNIEITNSMIKSVKQSYQKYQADLEAKKKLKADIEKRQKGLPERTDKELTRKRKLDDESTSIEAAVTQKKLAIEVTEEQVREVNSQL